MFKLVKAALERRRRLRFEGIRLFLKFSETELADMRLDAEHWSASSSGKLLQITRLDLALRLKDIKRQTIGAADRYEFHNGLVWEWENLRRKVPTQTQTRNNTELLPCLGNDIGQG